MKPHEANKSLQKKLKVCIGVHQKFTDKPPGSWSSLFGLLLSNKIFIHTSPSKIQQP